jgi:hypothetical protein
MKAVSDVRAVGQGAIHACEDQVKVDPTVAGCEPFKDLTCSMVAESFDDDRRHDERPAASCRLCLDQLTALMRDTLSSSADPQHAGSMSMSLHLRPRASP